MTDSITVPVRLAERSYDIRIGSGQLARMGAEVAQTLRPSSAVVISDENVASLYAEPVVASLTAAGVRAVQETVPAGEATKCIAQADMLWQALLRHGADRSSVVVAVGGGVVGDLAGFIAATYARGIAFLQVPTTLLAQVDSSVGGKVGVNLPTAKNMIGAFWQPDGVWIDTNVLASLPQREYRAGLGEVVKYGMILDADFFAYLEDHVAAIRERDDAVLGQVIARCCELKAEVVEADERETTGTRAVLNYGHTYCHAIEAVTGYGEYLHGEAVAIGMVCAARLALALGRIDAEIADRQLRLLQEFSLPTTVPAVDPAKLVEAMYRDKKAAHGQLRFVLPARLGHVELVDGVAETLVHRSLDNV